MLIPITDTLNSTDLSQVVKVMQIITNFVSGGEVHVEHDYTCKPEDGLVIVDTQTATITLPPLYDSWLEDFKLGTTIVIQKHVDSVGGTITIKGHNKELIEGNNTSTLVDIGGENLMVRAFKSGWKII